ncbi:MAG: hypothetical protein ACTTHG_00020 [Treponemataceae bacterium]
MTITIIATLMLMVFYFLLLYGGVAFIQNKKFLTSAPKEVYDALPDRKERFRGAHVIGWIIVAFALLILLGAVILGALDGIHNNFNFIKFFIRFLIMLYGMETFDILFFDWVLLCRSNFFPRFYPEIKDLLGPHLFGFNWKTHVLHYIMYIPMCAAVALICTLF